MSFRKKAPALSLALLRFRRVLHYRTCLISAFTFVTTLSGNGA